MPLADLFRVSFGIRFELYSGLAFLASHLANAIFALKFRAHVCVDVKTCSAREHLNSLEELSEVRHFAC